MFPVGTPLESCASFYVDQASQISQHCTHPPLLKLLFPFSPPLFSWVLSAEPSGDKRKGMRRDFLFFHICLIPHRLALGPQSNANLLIQGLSSYFSQSFRNQTPTVLSCHSWGCCLSSLFPGRVAPLQISGWWKWQEGRGWSVCYSWVQSHSVHLLAGCSLAWYLTPKSGFSFFIWQWEWL